jgi:hypothetical protein
MSVGAVYFPGDRVKLSSVQKHRIGVKARTPYARAIKEGRLVRPPDGVPFVATKRRGD